MSILKPVAALLALLTLPAMASAADDVAALRAEPQATKPQHNTRIRKLQV